MKFIQGSYLNKTDSLSSFRRAFSLSLLVIWLSIVLIVFQITHSTKQEIALSVVNSAREFLLIGDNRSATVIFQNSVPKWFTAVEVINEGGTEVINLKPRSKEILNINILLPIWEDSHTVRYGTVKVSYSIFGLFLKTVLWLVLISVGMLFLYKREHRRLIAELELKEVVIALEAENNIAKQVAHDIRSPLSAITMAVSLPDLNREEARDLLKSAGQRINLIAQEMLNKSKRTLASEKFIFTEKIDVIALIETLLTEKRVEYREIKDLIIEFKKGSDSIVANVNYIELQRVLSNLINNSIEAKQPTFPLKVIISAEVHDSKIILLVSDNGKGIPSHVLKRIGKEKLTYQKDTMKSGSGLGTFHARTSIEKMGGNIIFKSVENQGTSVILELLK